MQRQQEVAHWAQAHRLLRPVLVPLLHIMWKYMMVFVLRQERLLLPLLILFLLLLVLHLGRVVVQALLRWGQQVVQVR